MKTENAIEFLKKIELFKNLSESELKIIFQIAEKRSFAKNESLFEDGYERSKVFVISSGEVLLYKKTTFGEEIIITRFGKTDFISEGAIIDNSPHSTSARTTKESEIYLIDADLLKKILEENGKIAVKIFANVSGIISRRMSHSNTRLINVGAQYVSGKTRLEHDLLGERNVPDEFYYGVQTLRARENFNITGVSLSFYPTLVKALAYVKKAAALANMELGILPPEIGKYIIKACDLIIKGKHKKEFIVDMIQGGAGTSTNMNANEVIANIALEKMGHAKGEYNFCHPNNHVNLSQSTNDAYPTSVKIALINSSKTLIEELVKLVDAFRKKAEEFKSVIKMGRTQLQDAVPMTLGQEFEAYAVILSEEIERINQNADLMLSHNMGATAIGTGINSEPGYSQSVDKHLREVTGLKVELAVNLVEATQDTGSFVMFSSALKRLAIKLSKISNDLRLLSSGPRCGLNEINLPPMQPGSSIMPGKVNPVIPEVVNQIAFKVIGNDLTVTLAAEAGQLELNVMEPVIVQSLFESIEMLKNGMAVLRIKAIDGITANVEHLKRMVYNSIGLVTALNPVLGYEACSSIAKEALETGKGVYDIVLERKLLSESELQEILLPENMISPRKFK
jgi:aspartate ammonia-lyase